MTEHLPRIMGEMSKQDWTELSWSVNYRGDYGASITDPHHGATSPLEPEACSCQPAGLAFEGRCWKCGRVPESLQPKHEEAR